MCRAYHVHGMENSGWKQKKSEKGVYLAHYLSPPPPRGLPNESSGMLVGKLLLSSCWRTVWVLCFRLYLTVGETILQRERRACLSLSYGSPLSRVFCIKKEKRRRQQQGKGGFSYCCPIPLPRTDDIQEIFLYHYFADFTAGYFEQY